MNKLRDVRDDAYGVLAARSFMCKGEALLRLTMRCQCYAERQLKVADRLVKPRAVELPSRRNLRLGRRGAAEEHERGPYVSSSDYSFAVWRWMQRRSCGKRECKVSEGAFATLSWVVFIDNFQEVIIHLELIVWVLLIGCGYSLAGM